MSLGRVRSGLVDGCAGEAPVPGGGHGAYRILVAYKNPICAARAELLSGCHRIAPMGLDVPSDAVGGARVKPEEGQLRALCQ